MTAELPATEKAQCHGCNRVWTPDDSHPDGGKWVPAPERLDGVPHRYCPECLARRQEAMADLSGSAERLVEQIQQPPATPPQAAPESSG
ncbi:MAG: hypothetical protein ACE5O2_00090, partial [Armatimonadota bacterium]